MDVNCENIRETEITGADDLEDIDEEIDIQFDKIIERNKI